MRSSTRYWAPSSTPDLIPLLGVQIPNRSPMTPERHQSLLLEKFARLLDEAGPQAVNVMQGSVEHAPELHAISLRDNREHWAQAIVASDVMQPHLSAINWKREGVAAPLPQHQLREALEGLTLAEALETL